ncbi:DUF4238 domain-containing protein [Sinorhizobium meliloti]|uniref:DUF4238 domain-containing protein n=1 Tax=Rhizobium meliloti TaxID=382 RepID=UPI000FDA1C52|nr:DUF4238 domain-containing protein [Sinorhizobium meliloti]RVG19724.1 DUF4238 domain-containing protein [Sinorhizobium meliloti]
METQSHHHLPQSYLAAWKGADHKLTRYSMRYGNKVSVERRGPGSVGEFQNLYTLPGVPVEQRQKIEQLFMQRIDNGLSRPLRLLKHRSIPTDPSDRANWSRFVASLYFRVPDVVEALEGVFVENWLSAAGEYAAANLGLGLNEQQIVEHYEKIDPTAPRYWSKILLAHLVIDSDQARRIEELTWDVLEFLGATPLMTSDCPLMAHRSDDMTLKSLALAIGPNLMFIAYRSEDDRIALLGYSSVDLIERYNGHVVTRARDVVIAFDDGDREQVKDLMSTMRQPL